MNIEKINEICIEIYGKLAGDFEYRFVEAIEQAARATAEQSRDSVIEECAAVLDRRINGWRARGKTILNGQTVADELEHHAHAIRALKSQQDAAIESQRSGDGS